LFLPEGPNASGEVQVVT